MPLSRRRFLQLSGSACFTGSAGALGYTWALEPHWLQVVRRDLPIADLPSALTGRTLAQLSDLHVGPIVDPHYLRRAFHHVNDLQPDLIAITGDLMTCRAAEQVENTLQLLATLNPTPLGRLVALGNHDYGEKWSHAGVAAALQRGLTRLDFNVLRNDAVDISGLRVGALDDLWAGRCDLRRLLPAMRRGSASLILSHNPDSLDEPGWADYRGWVLAGHTHGGQCSAPWLGPPILPVRNRRYTSGHIPLDHDRPQLYINRGLGYLHRVRFNARPEITLFTLRPA